MNKEEFIRERRRDARLFWMYVVCCAILGGVISWAISVVTQ